MLLTLSIHRFVCFGLILLMTVVSMLVHTCYSATISALALCLTYYLIYVLMNAWVTGRLGIAFLRALSNEVNALVDTLQRKRTITDLNVKEMRKVLLGQFWCRHDLLLCLGLTVCFLVVATANLANINHVAGLYFTGGGNVPVNHLSYMEVAYLTGLDVSSASITLDVVHAEPWTFAYRVLGLLTVTYITGFFVVAVFSASKELNDNFIRQLVHQKR